MKKMIQAAAFLGALLPPLAARAHESLIPHANPHERALDGALLGTDVLALVALALIAATGAGIVLARARRKK